MRTPQFKVDSSHLWYVSKHTIIWRPTSCGSLTKYLGTSVYPFPFCFHQNSWNSDSHALKCISITWKHLWEMQMPGLQPIQLIQRRLRWRFCAGGLSPSAECYSFLESHWLTSASLVRLGKKVVFLLRLVSHPELRAKARRREEVQRKTE